MDARTAMDDGVSAFEATNNICMAWSSFNHDVPVDVKILRRDGVSIADATKVTIRPTSIAYQVTEGDDGSIIIHIPVDPHGRKFSVELQDDLLEYRSDGQDYVVAPAGSVVGIEPRHALLIFASPFPSSEMEPSMTEENTHTMVPGPINLDGWGDRPILYFPPGVYWMNQAASGDMPKLGEAHIKLGPNTMWVHLAPGAYVKGAVQFSTADSTFHLTGGGVLSGEHYVYQANPTTYYQGVKSDGDSLRMVSHYAVRPGQHWHCAGVTVANPPFNTIDFFGAEDMSATVADYKQVGGYFFQTDGPTLPRNSMMQDVFLHVNDDAIKAYHSGLRVERVIVWKGHNDPVIQVGWCPRASRTCYMMT